MVWESLEIPELAARSDCVATFVESTVLSDKFGSAWHIIFAACAVSSGMLGMPGSSTIIRGLAR